jgi:hypothetical protein
MTASTGPMGPLYIATERFTPSRGQEWTRYVAWSGLDQLTEVVSLDSLLCPPVVSGDHRRRLGAHRERGLHARLIHDLDYLVGRAGDLRERNLLCVFRNPAAEPVAPAGDVRFTFEGYDLVDVYGGQSVLTNCGGFPEVRQHRALEHGLLRSSNGQARCRRALAERYRARARALHVWAIFRADIVFDADDP